MMTIAVCLGCGEFKFGAFNSCGKCGAKPRDVDELALSLAMSDHYFDEPTLEQISKTFEQEKSRSFSRN